MSNNPDPGLMEQFCREVLPGMLTKACDVTTADADRAAGDILMRAEAVASLDRATRETLAAPFFEDAFTYDPEDAPPWMKAVTTLVVRNSWLEDLHANGPVNSGGITIITTYATGPLSHLLAARRRQPLTGSVLGDPFAGLAEEYPRAWACLAALRQTLSAGGGRVGYKMPDAPLPELPDPSEVTEAPAAEGVEPFMGEAAGVVFSGIDPRYDQSAIGYLKVAQEGNGLLLALSSLSRISRNSRKLLRTLDFLLAHRAKIITTNTLLTAKDVWVRNRRLVKPDPDDAMSALRDIQGLSGAHKKTVESYLARAAK